MKRLLALAATASALTLATATQAATLWTFTGASASDGPVSATALIDVTSSSLTVDLTSLLANPTSIGQEVSGIQFFFSSSPTGASLTSASGTEINIIKNKKAPNTTSGDDNIIGHWGTALGGGGLFLATAGTGADGGQPFDLIIGPGPYGNANSSITGKNSHISGTGHFVLGLAGLGSAPTLTGVRIGFGTSGTDYHDAVCSNPLTGGVCDDGGGGTGGGVPEPATWAMMIMGFGAAGAMLRRRRAVFG